ncbi:MAG: large-conductance mechanosensitive channel protein MscL [Candidatus Kapabacteria bacterium]|nr:large-conductance mechanosensitive channel protein MscL [Candidatus Kapabacteria bacterium]MBX7154719.1 large-conductance mechanosensitive channel protein MscL [Bacteroidota bacterium]
MMQEFKEFAMKGNVVDLAVGVIIGGAFGKIVGAMVEKILNPVIGLAIGGIDFGQLKIVLKNAVTDATGKVTTPEVAIGYGELLNTIVQFVIVAFVLFLVIKSMNSMKRKQEEAPAAPPAPTTEETLLTEIRDLLKQRA